MASSGSSHAIRSGRSKIPFIVDLKPGAALQPPARGPVAWIERIFGEDEDARVPQEVRVDVYAFLRERRVQMDRWFIMVRATVGLGIVGYLSIDAMGASGYLPMAMTAIVVYLLANAAVWYAGGPDFRYARWLFAALDLSFLLVLRHVFQFEALVDLNATMVGFFTLLLIAYTVYSDPALSRAIAVVTIAATGVTLGLDMVHDSSLHVSVIAYRVYPLRVVLLAAYLCSFCLVAYVLALRLRQQVVDYSIELHRRLQASVTTAAERNRREKLEELNGLKRSFIAVLSHELRTPIAPLRSSLEIVRSELKSGDDNIEMVDIAIESASRLQRLVQDYTQLAELLSSENGSIMRWNIRLEPLVREICARSNLYHVRLQGLDGIIVSAAPRLLAGALLALIRRAMLVSTGESLITIRGYTRGDYVTVSIHDPVSHLHVEDCASFDDPFVHSAERTFSSPNTGIELVLAQHSVRRLGGSLAIDSEDGEGTTVSCTLPGRQPGVHWLNDTQLRFELDYIEQ
jgi:signal transduction histidine kinase